MKIYKELHENYVIKEQAEELGWENRKVALRNNSINAIIGGSMFKNKENNIDYY